MTSYSILTFRFDQSILEDFAIFCGLALQKAITMKKIEQQRHRLMIAMEVMTFHSNVRPEEVETFKESQKAHIAWFETLRDWTFNVHDFAVPKSLLTKGPRCCG